MDVDDELVAMDHGAKVLSKSVATSMDSTDSPNHEISTADATTQKKEATEGRLSSLQELTWPGCQTPEREISQAEKFDNWVGFDGYREPFGGISRCWESGHLDLLCVQRKQQRVWLHGTSPNKQHITTFAALNFTDFRGSEVDELMMSTELSDREFILDLTLLARRKMSHLEKVGSKSPLNHRLEPLGANAVGEEPKVAAEKREFEAGLAQLTWRAWSHFSAEERERFRDKGRSLGVFVDQVMARRYPIAHSGRTF